MKPDAKGDRGETPLAREPERRPTREPEASGVLVSYGKWMRINVTRSTRR